MASFITVPSIVKAEVLEIYLQEFNRVNFLFWKLSPSTDKNEILHPKFVYGFPFNGENAPSIKETTGLLTIIFRYLILWQGIVFIASSIDCLEFFTF